MDSPGVNDVLIPNKFRLNSVKQFKNLFEGTKQRINYEV